MAVFGSVPSTRSTNFDISLCVGSVPRPAGYSCSTVTLAFQNAWEASSIYSLARY